MYRTCAIISRGLHIFYPIFNCGLYIRAFSITKQGNSSNFEPKIHSLELRAVSNQERVIMARIRYVFTTKGLDWFGKKVKAYVYF